MNKPGSSFVLESRTKNKRERRKRGVMVLQVEEKALVVEDVRKHPAGTVETLRALLAAGAVAQPDPHRKNFFEVQNGSKVYFVHVSPVTRKVMLLGMWSKETHPYVSAT